LDIGHEEVIPDEHNLVAQGFSQLFPPFKIILCHTVLDGHNRIFLASVDVELNECVIGQYSALSGEIVFAISVKF